MWNRVPEWIADILKQAAGVLLAISLLLNSGIRDLVVKKFQLSFDKALENRKAINEWTIRLDDMNKTFNSENPLPSKKTKATKDSWKNIDFNTCDKVDCNIKITEDEMNVLKMGHIPKAMEDHWFMYCDDNSINYYRSWTGIQIFKAYYKLMYNEYIIYMIEINNNKEEYNEENIQNSIDLFKNLIKAECKDN